MESVVLRDRHTGELRMFDDITCKGLYEYLVCELGPMSSSTLGKLSKLYALAKETEDRNAEVETEKSLGVFHLRESVLAEKTFCGEWVSYLGVLVLGPLEGLTPRLCKECADLSENKDAK